MDEKRILTEQELQKVSAGADSAGNKYREDQVLLDKENSKVRLVIQEVRGDAAVGFSYFARKEIYSLVPGGTPVLPLPMMPPQYSWYDKGCYVYTEAELDANWEPLA